MKEYRFWIFSIVVTAIACAGIYFGLYWYLNYLIARV
nr:MAG TPA: hypothetical protein [Caudoviricetes sp.]